MNNFKSFGVVGYNTKKQKPILPREWEKTQTVFAGDRGKYGWGILCGKPNNLVILDIDTHAVEGHELNSLEIWHKFLETNNIKFNTPTVKTTSGGYHYYFKYEEDEPRKCPACKTIDGKTVAWDFLCKRSFAYGVGSPHFCKSKCDNGCIKVINNNMFINGTSYDTPLQPLPKWVMKMKLGEYKLDLLTYTFRSKSARPKPKKTKTTKSTTHVMDKDHKAKFEKIYKLLQNINPDKFTDYDDWVASGFLLKNELGEEDGLKLWKEFSEKYCEEKYKEEVCDSKWLTLGIHTVENPILIGSLKKWVKEYNPEFFIKEQEEEIKQLAKDDPFTYDNNMFFEDYVKFHIDPALNSSTDVLTFFKSTVRQVIDKGNSYFITKNRGMEYGIVKDFSKRLLRRKLYIEGKRIYTFDDILDMQAHLSYDKTEFISDEPRVFSYFSGFQPNGTEEADIAPILEHIRIVLASEDEKIYHYLLCWMAHIIQSPQCKTQVCINVKGAMGSGKSCFFDFFCNNVVGIKYTNCNAPIDKILQKFNSLIQNQLVVVINEPKNYSAGVKFADKFKSLITEKYQTVEHKGMDATTQIDYTNYVILSNNSYVVKVEQNDRRFLCLETDNRYCKKTKENTEYFTKLFGAFKTAGKAFYNYLLKFNIDIDLTDVPETEMKKELMSASLNLPSQFVEDLKNGEYDHSFEESEDSIKLKTHASDLYNMFRDWLERNGHKSKINCKTFKKQVSVHIGTNTKRVLVNGRQKVGWNVDIKKAD